MIQAGTPATRACAGTSRVTTAPAATKAHSPTVTPQTMVALAPISPFFYQGFRVILTGIPRKSGRGVFTLVNTQLGPQKT